MGGWKGGRVGGREGACVMHAIQILMCVCVCMCVYIRISYIRITYIPMGEDVIYGMCGLIRT